MTLDATLMTPLAPTDMNGRVNESSPERITNFGPSTARNCDTRSQLPPASLIPTIFLQSAARRSDLNGRVNESSPERITNFGPSTARNCDTRSQLPPASLIPTIFLQSAARR